jgi:hypothetical protein
MRVAFWWKLNWSWFCIIQASLDEAKRDIREEEVEPFPDKEDIQRLSNEGSEGGQSQRSSVKKEERSPSPTPKSSDPETIPEPMEDIQSNIPEHLREYWQLAKRLNGRLPWPSYLGENEWLEIGDVLVELGHELARYGLIDMDLGIWENEIMHRIVFRYD